MTIGSMGRWRLRRELARWRRLAGTVGEADPSDLRELRSAARALSQTATRFAVRAEEEAARRMGVWPDRPPAPPATDALWRPEAWRAALPLADGHRSGHGFGDGVTLYHDCPLGLLSARQVRNGPQARAPYGLSITAYDFRGTYLSLSLQLPETDFAGTGMHHVIVLETQVDEEAPRELLARLNIAHGPDTAQAILALTRDGATALGEFDLGNLDLNEKRIGRIWIDLFLTNPAMNKVIVTDLVLSRRSRAQI